MLATFKENPRLITFGILTAFFSGPGQTFLMSFFTPGILESFRLDSKSFGQLYMVATLCGAISLPYLGRLLDRLDLLRFSIFMGSLLAIGCATMSMAQNILFLFLGLAFIRCFGQGAMSLMSTTSIAKGFRRTRGRALGIASQGHPLGEAILPLIVSFWIAQYDWRSGWFLLAIIIMLVFTPGTFFLLKKSKDRFPEKQDRKTKKDLRLLKDPRFVVALLMATVTPASLTGLFLFQAQMADLKNWELSTLAQAFILFAVFRSVSALIVGPWVDKISATKLLFLPLSFLLAATLCLWFGQNEIWAFVYLSFAGLTVGTGGSIKSSFWAEAYGTKNFGSVRGTVAFFVVLSTALSPAIVGWVMEFKGGAQIIPPLIAGYVLSGLILCFVTSFLYRK